MTTPPTNKRPECAAFIATSLDGYIARPCGGIDWLEASQSAVPTGEDCGYSAFMQTVDAVVMGRATYEKALSFPAWPFPDKPVWVISRSLQSLAPCLPASTQLLRDRPEAIVARAALRGFQRLYIDGGLLIQSFLRAGLLEQLTVTMVPVLLGAGRPLFGPMERDVRLRLRSSQTFPFGFVQSTYLVDIPT